MYTIRIGLYSTGGTMKFKVIDVVDETEVEIQNGWEPFRTAFDRGTWSILLVKDDNATKPKTPVSVPRRNPIQE